MNFIKRIFGQEELDTRLLGTWTSDQTDPSTKETLGDVTMTFNSKGDLIYKIREGDKVQLINMIFRTEGEYIASDQPSNPKKERTRYSFNNSTLILEFDGQKTRFLKSLD